MVQSLVRCKSCGLPAMLSENMGWQQNGIIFLKRFKGLRLAILDKQAINEISGRLSPEGLEGLGLMEKNATRSLVRARFSGLGERVSRYGNIKKRILEVMEDLSLLLGMGRLEVERLTPAHGGSMLVHKPFDIQLVSAGIAGVLEEIDGCSYHRSFSDTGSDAWRLRLDVSETDDFEDTGLRDYPEPVPVAFDGIGNRCDACGIPSALRWLRWDEIHGVVEAARSARRLGFLPAYMMKVIAEVAWGADESGKLGLVEEAARLALLEELEDGEAGSFDEDVALSSHLGEPAPEARDMFALRGWGCVTAFTKAGRAWQVTVANPVQANFVAGWIGALYTFLLEKKPTISWTIKGSTANYELE